MRIGSTMACCTAYYSASIGINGVGKDFRRMVIMRPTSKPYMLLSMLHTATCGGVSPANSAAVFTSDYPAKHPILATSGHLFLDFRERERILKNSFNELTLLYDGMKV